MVSFLGAQRLSPQLPPSICQRSTGASCGGSSGHAQLPSTPSKNKIPELKILGSLIQASKPMSGQESVV